MAHINLLPWRELKRKQNKKLFHSMMMLGLLVAVGIVLMMNYYVSYLIDNQAERNKTLQTEINTLDRQILATQKLKKTKAALLARISLIQSLHSSRILTVHLFDEMIKIIPPSLYLTKMERVKDEVIITGHSTSNTDISELMRKMEMDEWISKPALTIIHNTKQKPSQEGVSSKFQLTFVLKHKAEKRS